MNSKNTNDSLSTVEIIGITVIVATSYICLALKRRNLLVNLTGLVKGLLEKAE